MLLALAALVAAKVASVYIPVFYGRAVDALSPAPMGDGALASDPGILVTVPLALILAYGRPDATPAEVERAARLAAVSDGLGLARSHGKREERSMTRSERTTELRDFGEKPGPITFTANDTDDLQWTNVRTQRDERWPYGPERVRRRSDVLSYVPHAGIFGEEPESVVERVEYPIRDIEAEPFRYIIPDAVQVGLGEQGENIPRLMPGHVASSRQRASSPGQRLLRRQRNHLTPPARCRPEPAPLFPRATFP